MTIRSPLVAGSFYPATHERIHDLLGRILDAERPRIDYSYAAKNIVGCVVPHAGYIYSGYEAVHFFELLKASASEYDTFIILNPNHTGNGEEVEVDSSDTWDSPAGSVRMDKEFARALRLPMAGVAQRQEHAAEVMLPFLQEFLDYPFQVVAISMLHQSPAVAREVAMRIRAANETLGRRLMVIASSDFSHFEHPAIAREKDDRVLEQIKKMDIQGVYNVVRDHQVSVCGYGPIMTLMAYAQHLGEGVRPVVLARGNSGKAHPSNSVVDYITILFYSETKRQDAGTRIKKNDEFQSNP